MKFLQAIKNMKKRNKIVAMVLASAMALSGIHTVSASVINDAQNKKNEAQQELDEINGQIDEIKAAQSDLQEEMEAYDEQLMSLLTDMDLLEADIAEKQTQIDEANANLQAAEEQEQRQYEAMKTRIQYMYENGDDNYWEAMMGAESITDLLNRVEYVSDVYDYDRAQLTVYQDTVQQVADLKDQLDSELAEMEELEISYKDQASSLQSIISEKSEMMDNFDTQLANAKSLASEYASTIKKQNQIIAAEKAKQEEEERKAAAAAAAAARQNAANQSNSATNASNSSNSGNTASSNISGTGNTTSENTSASSGTGLTDSGLNPSYTTGVSGSDVVAYASQFVGNPYVYGGTSLTEGADCSYFVMACFGQFGISLPRNSYSMQSCGQAVSYDCAQPGDIICYSGHVAIYMGNGRIVHASSPKNGICYGNATYRTILTIRRVL